MIAILRHMLQPDSTICRRTAIKTRGMPVDITLADRDTVLALTDELVAVYARTFGAPGYDERPEAIERFRSEQLPRHADRDGFRCALARRDGRVVGFAYGYTGQRGQWWPEHVASHAPEDVVRDWLGGHFEFVELAVEPAEQGRGVGSALHDALLTGLPHERALLTTYRDDRPAPRLYRRKGWHVLVDGLDEQFPVLGGAPC
jgi:ribosomal protein S18 acetylase RimI-like enzyme